MDRILQDNTDTEIGQQSSQDMRSTKMGSASMGKLIFSMSIPAILSMLVQSLYNIVDSIFVANIQFTNVAYNGNILGDDSFLAVSVVFPMVMLTNAVAIGLAIGANAYISRKLGEGNNEKASQAARTAIVLAVIAWAVMATIGLVFSRSFVRVFVNSDNASDIDYVVNQATMYITIYMACSIGFFLEQVGNKMLQATGNMRVPMVTQLIGAITNIILDAIFILVFGWGVFGAVLATIIGQWLAGAFVMVMLFTRRQDINVSFEGYRPHREYVKSIFRVGLPAFVINALGSFVIILLNDLLKNGNGVWILSAYFKVQSFIFMPIFGLMQGTMPIIGYNYGANNRDRYKQARKIIVITVLCIATAGLAIFQLMPQYIMRILTDNPILIQEGCYAFRIISLAFIPAGMAVVMINSLQAVNSAFTSLLLSLTRQLIFLLPLAYILYGIGGQDYVWYCYLIAELLSLAIFLPIGTVRIGRQFQLKQLQHEQGKIANLPR